MSRRGDVIPRTQFEFNLEGIGDRLAQNVLHVPIFQRSYAWEQDQISDYWNDIYKAFTREGTLEYFLGSVVLSDSDDGNGLKIIDGQQRLATTAILYASMRDELRARDEDRRADLMQRDFLATEEWDSTEDVPRLRLNSDDDEFFRDAVIEGHYSADDQPVRESHVRLQDALLYFRSKLSEMADAVGEQWRERFKKFRDFVANDVRIVTVVVPSEADAYLIFETLNDRGADLTIADLLKNYLFGQSGSRLDVVRDGWMQSLGALDISAENALFTTFIRHYWSSIHGAVRERDLYNSIKENISSSTQAVRFVEGLKRAAGDYAALVNRDHIYWRNLGSSARDNIETLLRLKLEQNRPLLLAVMQHFDEAEVKRCLRALVSWSVRGLVVGGIGGGKTETFFCRGAVAVRSGEVKSTEELLEVISEIVPSDDQFRVGFSMATERRGPLARYYLLALERVLMDEAEPELVPNQNEEEVNLEHVLPKKPSEDAWSHFDLRDINRWVYRLGNMALLKRSENDRIGNEAWDVKRPILEASSLELTQEAAEYDDWDTRSIEQRQGNMAELAIRAWPREPQD